MHALGNDFMLLDSAQPALDLVAESVRQLADRRTGIGFDQLLRLRESEQGLAVDIVNADGSPAEQCGNGMRAVALLLQRQRQLGPARTISTPGGLLKLGPTADKQFFVDLPVPVMQPEIHAITTAAGNHVTTAYPVMVGNPHLIVLVDDPAKRRSQDGQELAELRSAATAVYRTGDLAQGCNAGFARYTGDHIELCVWERGAGPTPACGSGACAAAWVIMQQQDRQGRQRISVAQPGGRLMLEWDTGTTLRMIGPASYSYHGTVSWPD